VLPWQAVVASITALLLTQKFWGHTYWACGASTDHFCAAGVTFCNEALHNGYSYHSVFPWLEFVSYHWTGIWTGI